MAVSWKQLNKQAEELLEALDLGPAAPDSPLAALLLALEPDMERAPELGWEPMECHNVLLDLGADPEGLAREVARQFRRESPDSAGLPKERHALVVELGQLLDLARGARMI